MKIIHNIMGFVLGTVLIASGMLIGGCKADSQKDNGIDQNNDTNITVEITTNNPSI